LTVVLVVHLTLLVVQWNWV